MNHGNDDGLNDGIESIGEGRHLALRRVNGWEFTTRPAARGVVAVVAITDDDRIVLVEQHRPPVGGPVIELPAGLVGDATSPAGESPADAARRELLEETGFASEHWSGRSVDIASSAGLTDEVVQVFGASGARRVAAGGGVDDERITVRLVPLDTLPAWLWSRAAEGVVADGRVWAAPMLARELGLRP